MPLQTLIEKCFDPKFTSEEVTGYFKLKHLAVYTEQGKKKAAKTVGQVKVEGSTIEDFFVVGQEPKALHFYVYRTSLVV